MFSASDLFIRYVFSNYVSLNLGKVRCSCVAQYSAQYSVPVNTLAMFFCRLKILLASLDGLQITIPYDARIKNKFRRSIFFVRRHLVLVVLLMLYLADDKMTAF